MKRHAFKKIEIKLDNRVTYWKGTMSTFLSPKKGSTKQASKIAIIN